MAATKIYKIFVIFFIIQISYAKVIGNRANSLKTSEDSKQLTATEEFLVFTFSNSLALGLKYGDKSYGIAQQILKDPSLDQDHQEPEILEFKESLNQFVKEYEVNDEPQKSWDIMETFTNTIDKYLELTEDEVTEESKVLVDLINKYKCKELATEFTEDFEIYLENLKETFEKIKSQLDDGALDLYEMYTSLEFKKNVKFYELGKDD